MFVIVVAISVGTLIYADLKVEGRFKPLNEIEGIILPKPDDPDWVRKYKTDVRWLKLEDVVVFRDRDVSSFWVKVAEQDILPKNSRQRHKTKKYVDAVFTAYLNRRSLESTTQSLKQLRS